MTATGTTMAGMRVLRLGEDLLLLVALGVEDAAPLAVCVWVLVGLVDVCAVGRVELASAESRELYTAGSVTAETVDNVVVNPSTM